MQRVNSDAKIRVDYASDIDMFTHADFSMVKDFILENSAPRAKSSLDFSNQVVGMQDLANLITNDKVLLANG